MAEIWTRSWAHPCNGAMTKINNLIKLVSGQTVKSIGRRLGRTRLTGSKTNQSFPNTLIFLLNYEMRTFYSNAGQINNKHSGQNMGSVFPKENTNNLVASASTYPCGHWHQLRKTKAKMYFVQLDESIFSAFNALVQFNHKQQEK